MEMIVGKQSTSKRLEIKFHGAWYYVDCLSGNRLTITPAIGTDELPRNIKERMKAFARKVFADMDTAQTNREKQIGLW